MKIFGYFFFIALPIFQTFAFADEGFGPHPELMVSGLLVSPNTSLAGELGGALHFAPLPDHLLFVGPRSSVLYSPSPGRVDWNVGGEMVLWVANAVGVGGAIDYVPVATLNNTGVDAHWRFEPMMALHSKHFGDDGAIGARLRLFYDTHYQVGFGLGMTLQWSGIPQIGI